MLTLTLAADGCSTWSASLSASVGAAVTGQCVLLQAYAGAPGGIAVSTPCAVRLC